MKEKYIELIEKALGAYSDEHILSYFERVKAEGLTEHGFPRLAVNIGVLIAHGHRLDLCELFVEMMDFCCKSISKVKAANDFSVREVVYCLMLLEEKGYFTEELKRWKSDLATIEPESCYNIYAKTPDDKVNNWALFSALSEQARQIFVGCDSEKFIDIQLENQIKRLDENGMYMDNLKSDVHQPIVYDLVPRFLFSLLLHFGYRGRHYETIDSALRKAGLLTLDMQSTTGEIAFGGRSNQFVHNEPMLAISLEFEANRYAREGNLELAGRFKAAIARSIEVCEEWLSKDPIRHIKNRFPTETKYGCESYAYFDKYMITTASQLFMAYIMCDDTIKAGDTLDTHPKVFKTSEHFHKIFARCGDYAIELDTNADPHYDANGLGRVHKKGAPTAICLSCPCPADPKYTVDTEPAAFSASSALLLDGKWHFGADAATEYKLLDTEQGNDFAAVTLLCRYNKGECEIKESYKVCEDGISITVSGQGDIGFLLPAFYFDGEKNTEIVADTHCLTVSYNGWLCRYTTDGEIVDLLRIAANRNGHYRTFLASGKGALRVKIEILDMSENE